MDEELERPEQPVGESHDVSGGEERKELSTPDTNDGQTMQAAPRTKSKFLLVLGWIWRMVCAPVRFLADDKRRNTTLALITIVSAALSAYSVKINYNNSMLTFENAQMDRASKRPYVEFKDERIEENTQDKSKYNVIMPWFNMGARAMHDVKFHVIIVDKSNTLLYRNDSQLSNDVTPQQGNTWAYPDLKKNKSKPYFLIYTTKYEDPFINQTYSQIFYFTWDGRMLSVSKGTMSHVNAQQRDQLLAKWGSEIKEFLGGDIP